ncbi:MAG TPA: anhydro-N-acetylmuramic acid kinase [Solibacterales bacterium]|nr:anhydro-N-acetylmuramic acid kinase [Bryobacterales bacterium]
MKVAGIMSGTSLDGIDVAVVEIGGRRGFATLAKSTTAYPKTLRAALLAVSNRETHTAAIARLHFLLPELYAEAVRRLGVAVDLIGCHGQTIFHEGTPIRFHGRRIASTLQIGDGAVLAERTGVPVVSDFRTADIAAGGRGAPLVPFVDYHLFRHARRGRVALNLGGIANITAIPPGAPPEDVIAFDTGPANMVIDGLVARHTGGKRTFDKGGKIALRGTVDRELLDRLLRDRYYRQAPPKTAGREQYGEEFLAAFAPLALEDAVATATALTAATVAASIERFVRPRMPVDDLIVSGGGAHNPRILAFLTALLPGIAIRVSSDYGIDVDAKEAVAFAILAHQTWQGRAANLPSATGAGHPAILGKISYPPPR